MPQPHPQDLPYSCIAFNSRIFADVELPGSEFRPESDPPRELCLQRADLGDLLEPLNRRLVSKTAVMRDLILTTTRQDPPGGKLRRWALEAENAVTFTWRENRGDILYQPGPEFSLQRFGFILLHTFLPVYFTVNDTYQMLHAACVEAKGRTIAFLAPSMGGKSTLANYLSRQGYTLLSDDKLATYRENGSFMAVGAYPFCRNFREFESLGKFVGNFDCTPRQIDAAFILKRMEPHAKVSVRPLKGIEQLQYLIERQDVFISFRQGGNFNYLAAMARSLPIYELQVPWSLDRLDKVCQMALSTSANLPNCC